MAEEHVNVNISATDNLSKPARTAARSLEDLGDKSGEAAVKVQVLEEQLDDARDAATIAARRIDALERQIKQMGNEATKSAGKIALLESRLSKMSRTGLHGKKGLAGGLAIGMKLSRMFKLILIPAIFDAVGAVATLGNALVAMGSAAIGGLGPLTGLLAAYPGYLAAIGQGYGVVALGMEKVKNVMQTLETPIKQMKEDIGNALLPGFRKLTETIRGYIPMVQKALIGTAKVMSGTVGRISGFLDQAGTKSSIGRIMQTNTNIIRSLGKAAIPVMQTLLNVMVAAGPMLTRFTQDFAIFMSKVAMSSANQRGLSDFFSKTYTVTKKLIKVTADLSTALFNIFKIGAGLGGEMGQVIIDLTEKFRYWTETAKGQERIAQWFADMKPIIWEVGRLIADLGKAIGTIAMDKTVVKTLEILRTDTLPALVTMAQSASGKFLPTLAKIIGTLAQIFVEFKVFPVILDGIATGLDFIATTLQQLPSWAKSLLGYMVTLASVIKFGGLIGFFNMFGMGGGAKASMGRGIGAIFSTLLAGITNFGYVAKQVLFGSAGAIEGMKLLGSAAAGTATKLLAVAAPAAAALAIVGLGLAAWKSAQDIRAMQEETKKLNDELARTGTAASFEAVSSSIDDLQAKYEQAKNPSFFSTTAFSNGLRTIGSWLQNEDPMLEADYIMDEIKKKQAALGQSTQMAGDLARSIFGTGGDPFGKSYSTNAEDNPQIKLIREMAEATGVDLTKGFGAARQALSAYYVTNYKSVPAVRDLYTSLDTLSDTTANAADRMTSFTTGLQALQDIWTGNGRRDAAVQAAKGIQQLQTSMDGATVSFRKGNLVFKATAENNFALHDALMQQSSAATNVANETFKQTDSVKKATAAYRSQYDTLVDKLAKGLRITQKHAKQLANQYMATPKFIKTAFKVDGFKEWIAAAPRSYKEVRDWINSHPITPKIKTPELNDKKWRKQSQKRANKAWAGRYAAAAGKKTTTTQTTVFNTSGLDAAINAQETVKNNVKWINQNPIVPQVKTDQLDAALTVATQVRDVMREISDLDFNDSSKKKNERRFGGPVFAGTQYLVGEAGAEAFIGTNGAFQLIGTRGREYRTFPQDGMVIPNSMLPEGELVGAVPVQASVHIGTINATSDIDVVRAVKQGIREAERNARERR
jgi:hypothetical protein